MIPELCRETLELCNSKSHAIITCIVLTCTTFITSHTLFSEHQLDFDTLSAKYGIGDCLIEAALLIPFAWSDPSPSTSRSESTAPSAPELCCPPLAEITRPPSVKFEQHQQENQTDKDMQSSTGSKSSPNSGGDLAKRKIAQLACRNLINHLMSLQSAVCVGDEVRRYSISEFFVDCHINYPPMAKQEHALSLRLISAKSEHLAYGCIDEIDMDIQQMCDFVIAYSYISPFLIQISQTVKEESKKVLDLLRREPHRLFIPMQQSPANNEVTKDDSNAQKKKKQFLFTSAVIPGVDINATKQQQQQSNNTSTKNASNNKRKIEFIDQTATFTKSRASAKRQTTQQKLALPPLNSVLPTTTSSAGNQSAVQCEMCEKLLNNASSSNNSSPSSVHSKDICAHLMDCKDCFRRINFCPCCGRGLRSQSANLL